jgi:hypothetical protein
MAKAKVTHSDDAVQITFNGDRRNPEPGTAVIKFPGGHVEVSRCTDGSYWAHVEVVDPANTIASRIDYVAEASREHGIPDIPAQEHIKKLAVRIANNVPHFDPDAL